MGPAIYGQHGVTHEKYNELTFSAAKSIVNQVNAGAEELGVLPLLPIFRPFFHFHKNPSSSVISGTFSRENRFPPKRKKRPKIAKHTKHEPLPKRDAISLQFAVHPNGGSHKIRLTDPAGMRSSSDMISKQSP